MNQRPILRRCIACKKLLDRQELLRIVKDKQNGISLNQGMGRSAYLCPKEACLEESLKRKRLQKALRCKVPENVIKALQNKLNQCIDCPIEAI